MRKNRVNASLVSICACLVLLTSSLASADRLSIGQERYRQLVGQPNLLPLPSDASTQQKILLAATMAYGGTQNLKGGELSTLLQANTNGLAVHLPTSDTVYDWSIDHWVPSARGIYTFQGSTINITSWIEQLWEADSSKWQNSFYLVNTYDGDKLSEAVYQSWSGGEWNNMSRDTTAYDANGYPDMTTSYSWSQNQWNLSICEDFTYSSGLLMEVVVELRQNNAWVTSSRTTFAYDGSKRLISELDESFDGISNWINSAKKENTYNLGGKMTESIYQTWNGIAWENSSRNTYAYDGSGNQTLAVAYDWLGITWSATDTDTMKYDGQNRNYETVSYTIGNNLQRRHDRAFDTDGDMILDIESTNAAQTGWKNTNRAVYVFGTATAVREDNGALPVSYALSQNYPNPFNPTTTIPYRLSKRSQVEISIYNVLGQQVKTLENGQQLAGFYHTTWDGTDASGRTVASGIYYYKIKTEDFTETRKMVLLK
jgi:hypothetical protein